MNIHDTTLELKEFREYGNKKLREALKVIFPQDVDLMVLWDNNNGTYGLMCTITEYNYPTEPNFDEDYYFVINRKDLSVNFEDTPEIYKPSLKDLNQIRNSVLHLIMIGNKLFSSREFDCIILTSRSLTKVIGVADNTEKVELFDIPETAKCKRVLYLTA